MDVDEVAQNLNGRSTGLGDKARHERPRVCEVGQVDGRERRKKGRK